MNKLRFLLYVCAISALLASCAKQEQVQSADTTQAVVKTGQGLGIIRAVDTAGKSVTLAHNNIPDIMDAMTMTYPVSNATMLKDIAVGDSVRFTLRDDGQGNYLITQIAKK